MESFLHNAPCCYFSADDEGLIGDVNTFICNELGYEEVELKQKKLDHIFTLATRIFHQTHFFPLLKMQGHAEEIFITLRTKNGDDLPLLLNASRQVEAGKAITKFIGITVHNRKKFEDELVAAKKAAEKALRENTELSEARESLKKHSEMLEEKMSRVRRQNEELKQFNRVVTHDLQEPLRKLSVFGNLLGSETRKTDPKLVVDKLLRTVTQMRSIVSGLQQYVWLTETSTRIAPLNLHGIILSVQQKLRSEYPEADLQTRVDPLPTLRADREQMQLLFYELLTNAIRFRREATVEVTVHATLLQRNRFIHLDGHYSYGDFLKIEVSDNGLGFDPQYQEQLFDLFRKLHSTSGRGVGLALCKKVAENHNGSISIAGRPEKGTTVTIFLPVFAGKEEVAVDPGSPARVE